MAVSVDDMSHEDKCVVFACGVIDALRDCGFVEGPHYLTPAAVCLFDQIHAEGFRPSATHMDMALEALGLCQIGRMQFACLINSWLAGEIRGSVDEEE